MLYASVPVAIVPMAPATPREVDHGEVCMLVAPSPRNILLEDVLLYEADWMSLLNVAPVLTHQASTAELVLS